MQGSSKVSTAMQVHILAGAEKVDKKTDHTHPGPGGGGAPYIGQTGMCGLYGWVFFQSVHLSLY